MNNKLTKAEIEIFQKCIAPIFCENKDGKIRNGTITFYSDCTAINPIGITNYHVYEKFTKQNRDVMLGTDLKIDLKERLIDCNKSLDIATFKLKNNELVKINKISSTQMEPLFEIPNNEKALIIGYPNKFIDFKKYGIILPSLCFDGLPVNYSSCKDLIVSKTSIKEMKCKEFYCKKEQVDLCDLGGMSGCAIFSYIRIEGKIIPILLGIIKENSNEYNCLMAVSINKINFDGSIVT